MYMPERNVGFRQSAPEKLRNDAQACVQVKPWVLHRRQHDASSSKRLPLLAETRSRAYPTSNAVDARTTSYVALPIALLWPRAMSLPHCTSSSPRGIGTSKSNEQSGLHKLPPKILWPSADARGGQSIEHGAGTDVDEGAWGSSRDADLILAETTTVPPPGDDESAHGPPHHVGRLNMCQSLRGARTRLRCRGEALLRALAVAPPTRLCSTARRWPLCPSE